MSQEVAIMKPKSCRCAAAAAPLRSAPGTASPASAGARSSGDGSPGALSLRLRLAAAAAGLVLLVASGQPAACAARVEVKMSAAVELVSVVQLLGSETYAYPGFFRRALPSVDESAERFKGYGDHPVVRLTADLDAGGFDFVTRDQFLMNLSDPPELRPRLPLSRRGIKNPGDAEKLEGWLDGLRDFSSRSGFPAHFAAQEQTLAPYLAKLQEAFGRVAPVEKLERYTGLDFRGTYALVVSPYAGPGGPANDIVELDDGSYAIHTLFGPHDVVKGRPVFDIASIQSTMWHELSHGVLDTMALIYREDIERSKPLFKRLVFPCYGDWNQCVKEHMVRAVETRLLAQEFGEEAARINVEQEEKEGFRYLRAFVDSLAEYESDRRRYPTMVDFYPRWIDLLGRILEKEVPDPRDRAVPPPPRASATWIGHVAGDFQGEGRRLRTLRYLDLLLARDPAPRLLRMRALLRHLSGGHAQALADATAALARSPEDVEALLLKGISLEELEDEAGALAVFMKTAELCQKSPPETRSQACVDPHLVFNKQSAAPAAGERRTLAEAADARERIERLTLRISSQPDAAAFRERGILRYLVGEPGAALADFDRALELSPGDPSCLLSRGVALQSLSKREDALASYDRAMDSLKDADPMIAGELLANVLSSRASLLDEGGDPARAREDLARALKVAPDDWPRRLETLQLLRKLKAKVQ